jgi:hypothetical protein
MVSQLFSLSYDHIQANASVSIFVTFNFLSTVIIYFIKKLKL